MAEGNKGKALEKKIVSSLNLTPGVYGLRLRESIKGVFCMGCKRYLNISNKSRKQPFDFIAITGKGGVALEAKSIHTLSFDFRNLKPHQEEELMRLGSVSNSAFVVIHFVLQESVYMIPIVRYMEIKKEYETAEKPRKSLPFARVKEEAEKNNCFELKNTRVDKKTILDFASVFKKIGLLE